jgi:hypothetical protein
MGDSNRKQLFASIETHLKTIQAGATPIGSTGTYETTIRSVVRKKKTTPEIDAADLPQIQLWKGTCSYTHIPGKRVEPRWLITLLVILTEDDEEATDDMIDAARDDIIACMFQDQATGLPYKVLADQGYKLEIVEDFEGVHEDELVGQLRMVFAVSWERNLKKS